MTKGNISVNTENLFPIIKKWLYSDKDIFVRELVSNGCDAVSKLSKLSAMGEAGAPESGFVDVIINKEEKTLTFSDNGIGMTEEEVVKYIAEVAFSGAAEFIDKYKDETDENRIIGHFGLGFYSAFMVSDRVDINTLSYKENAKSVLWSCDGGTEYEISEGSRKTVGTDIVLHIAEDSLDFLEENTVKNVLTKYCAFLPTPIYLYMAGSEKGECINDLTPLWLKKPSECKEEEYIEFYHKVFPDINDPLFYIHLNVDFPFNLKGILYFPKLRHEFEMSEGQIKLFNNQVFVADNIKEVIPEFLLLLKGCIDCPDLPLNVSRSFLQNDGYAAKVSAHITKKVADKLLSLYNNERESYNKYWDDINPFVKYGCLKDEKFYDKVKNAIVYKTTDDTYLSLEDYLDNAKAKNHENTVYYVSDPILQSSYIEMFKAEGLSAVILPVIIDNHFISFVESKKPEVRFMRIDSSLASALQKEGDSADKEKLCALFKEAIGDEKLNIDASPLKTDAPAVMLLDEQSRRMGEMMKMYGSAFPKDMFSESFTLNINLANQLVKALSSFADNKEKAYPVARQIYDLARLAQRPLEGEELAEFIKRTSELLLGTL